MKRARAVWFEAPGVASVREEPLREVGPDDVLVRGLASGVSSGTERLVLLGRIPEDARGLLLMEHSIGSFELPMSYGYSAVGVIEASGVRVRSLVGQRVFALHPHHDRFVVPASSVRALRDDVPPARQTLAANLETAINVVWDAEIALGDRVVVIGAGVVGLLVARLASRAGASSVIVHDTDASRLDFAASALGLHTDASIDVAEGADVLIEASGSTSALEALLYRAGFEARVVAASFYGDDAPAVRVGGSFHPNRVTVRSSQVGAISPSRRARWNHARRFDLVGELLADAWLDGLIGKPIALSEAPSFYAALARGDRPCPPHVVFDLEGGS